MPYINKGTMSRDCDSSIVQCGLFFSKLPLPYLVLNRLSSWKLQALMHLEMLDFSQNLHWHLVCSMLSCTLYYQSISLQLVLLVQIRYQVINNIHIFWLIPINLNVITMSVVPRVVPHPISKEERTMFVVQWWNPLYFQGWTNYVHSSMVSYFQGEGGGDLCP